MLKFMLKAILTVLIVFIAITVIANFALNTESKSVPQTSAGTTQAMYVLSIYDGRIALFKTGYSMPVEIYDVYLDTLPQEEQDNLAKGISANSDEEALRLIEDYTS